MTDAVGDADRSSLVRRASVAVALGLCVAPIVAYAALLVSVSSNVPYLDDYDVILAFLNDFAAAQSFSERVALPFAQHAEHRMAFLRLLALASWQLQDGVDFDLLNRLGSLGLLLLCALLYRATALDGSTQADRVIAFAPVPLLLFQPQFWTCLLWPTSSLANFWVVAFALASALLIVRTGAAAFLGAVCLAVLATFAQGNGTLVWPLGMLALAVSRRPRELALFTGAGALVLLFYASGYVRPPGPGLLTALSSNFEPLLYALNLIGSAPAFATQGVSLFAGAAGVAIFVGLLAAGLPRRNLPLTLLLLFVLGSIAANALGRTGLGGPNYALQSPRYQFFSCVFWAASYLGWSELAAPSRNKQVLTALFTISALVFSLASFQSYGGNVERVSQRLQRGMLSWVSDGRGLVFPDEERASAILRRSIELGVYVVPVDELMLSTPIENAPARDAIRSR